MEELKDISLEEAKKLILVLKGEMQTKELERKSEKDGKSEKAPKSPKVVKSSTITQDEDTFIEESSNIRRQSIFSLGMSKFTLEDYDGKKDPETWILKFKECLENENIQEKEDQFKLLEARLYGKARLWFLSTAWQMGDIDSLLQELIIAFSRNKSITISNVYSFIQGPLKVQDYAWKKLRLCLKYDAKMSESEKVHLFISGLKPQIRSKVELQPLDSYFSAVNFAEQIESQFYSTSKINKSNYFKSQRTNFKHPNEHSKNEKFCGFCKTHTHNETECWKKHPELKPKNKKVNILESIELPKVELNFEDSKIEFLIDTGASISLINEKLLKYHKFKIKESNEKIKLANGNKLKCLGRILAKLENETHEFRIIGKEIEYNGIIGNDILSHCVIDGKNKTLLKDGKIYPFSSVKQQNLELAVSKVSLVSENTKLNELLNEFNDIFPENPKMGMAKVGKHEIKVFENAQPIAKKPYTHSKKEEEFINQEVERLLKDKVIEISSSPWAAPIVLSKKKDGSYRICPDFRDVNKVTIGDSYPIPTISDLFDRLGGSSYFSTLDARSGYWQIQMEESSKEKTAFITKNGLFQWKVMPFGLKNAPSTFQRCMDTLFSDYKFKFLMVYLDDIIIFSKSLEDHMNHLKLVFERIREANMFLKLSKCKFIQTKVNYLGHVITKDGIMVDDEKVASINQFTTPKNSKMVQRFLGLCGYYRKFIKDFSKIANPLFELLKKNSKFNWTNEHEIAFKTLKKKLTEAPILKLPNFEEKFQLFTDASGVGLGAVLEQSNHVVAYASTKLKEHEKNYTTYEKEALALVWAIKKFRQYLHGREIEAFVDNGPVAWFSTSKFQNASERIKRWILFLQQENVIIKHRSGKQNVNADALSRLFEVNLLKSEPNIDLTSLLQEQERDLQIKELSSKQNFEKIDGILHFIDSKNGVLRKRKVIPKSLQMSLMKQVHDNFGHLGFMKTLHLVKERFYWPNFRRDIEFYVTSCTSCNAKKGTKRNWGTLNPIPVGDAFEMVGLDIVGPLTETKNGNKYIVVFSDYLTKYPEAFAVKDITADTVAKLLVEEIALRYGLPAKILTDQAKNFRAKISKLVYKILQAKKLCTTPYHPKTDGLVEKFNGTLTKMLSHYVNENHTDWDEFIPFVLYAYRATKHTSTKYSPFELLFGRKPRIPLEIALENETVKSFDADDYFKNVTSGMKLLHDNARENINKSQLTQKFNYDEHRGTPPKFEVGQKVMIFVEPRKKKSLTTKFLDKWSGPYEIVENHGQTLKIRNAKNKIQVVNIERVKSFKSRDESLKSEENEHVESESDDLIENLQDEKIQENMEEKKVKVIRSFRRKSGTRKMTYYTFLLSNGTERSFPINKLKKDEIAQELIKQWKSNHSED